MTVNRPNQNRPATLVPAVTLAVAVVHNNEIDELQTAPAKYRVNSGLVRQVRGLSPHVAVPSTCLLRQAEPGSFSGRPGTHCLRRDSSLPVNICVKTPHRCGAIRFSMNLPSGSNRSRVRSRRAKAAKPSMPRKRVLESICKVAHHECDQIDLTKFVQMHVGQFVWPDGWLTGRRFKMLRKIMNEACENLSEFHGIAWGTLVKNGALVVFAAPRMVSVGTRLWLYEWAKKNGCSFDWFEWL